MQNVALRSSTKATPRRNGRDAIEQAAFRFCAVIFSTPSSLEIHTSFVFYIYFFIFSAKRALLTNSDCRRFLRFVPLRKAAYLFECAQRMRRLLFLLRCSVPCLLPSLSGEEIVGISTTSTLLNIPYRLKPYVFSVEFVTVFSETFLNGCRLS